MPPYCAILSLKKHAQFNQSSLASSELSYGIDYNIAKQIPWEETENQLERLCFSNSKGTLFFQLCFLSEFGNVF